MATTSPFRRPPEGMTASAATAQSEIRQGEVFTFAASVTANAPLTTPLFAAQYVRFIAPQAIAAKLIALRFSGVSVQVQKPNASETYMISGTAKAAYTHTSLDDLRGYLIDAIYRGLQERVAVFAVTITKGNRPLLTEAVARHETQAAAQVVTQKAAKQAAKAVTRANVEIVQNADKDKDAGILDQISAGLNNLGKGLGLDYFGTALGVSVPIVTALGLFVAYKVVTKKGII